MNDFEKESEFGQPITCPCCKSENIKNEEIYRVRSGGEGIVETLFDYWVCKDCGVMFQRF